MKRTAINTFTALLLALTASCANDKKDSPKADEDIVGTDQEKSKLTLGPDNVQNVFKEFELDYWAASEKYTKQKIEVECAAMEDQNGRITLQLFSKTGNKSFEKMPLANIGPGVRLLSDLTTDQNLQGLVTLMPGYEQWYDLPKEEFRFFYLVYDKEKDRILTSSEDTEHVATYLTLQNSSNSTAEMKADFEKKFEHYNSMLFSSLKNGNLWYYKIEGKDDSWNFEGQKILRYKSPIADIIGENVLNTSLVPCTYTIAGTVATPIGETKIMGQFYYDFKLVNSKYLKENWIIDKGDMFKTQILYN